MFSLVVKFLLPYLGGEPRNVKVGSSRALTGASSYWTVGVDSHGKILLPNNPLK